MRWPRVRLGLRTMMVLVAIAAVVIVVWERSTRDVPDNWDAAEFRAGVARVVDFEGKARVDVELLAWSTQEDDRPLRFDSALAWTRIEKGKDVRWALVEMYRHPLEHPEWYDSGTDHGPRPLRYYANPPRNLEVYAFVDSLWGSNFFGIGPNFRRLAAAVRKLTWRATIGESPTRSFK